MKPQPKKESWVVLIKSPKIKFHDIGYIIKDGEDVTLQLYSAGTAVESFEINHFICTRDGCMRKSSFNAEYLNSAYDDDLLKDLLMRRPIFDGKNLQKLQDGFEQKIKSKEYDILYKVTVDTLYFKDKKNHILFKLKRQ
ncbi:Putative lipoprotein [hydrothermal vent metagenome]|uniref:Putative lipoprotein n=1 Tax=hydrothermal vent metagenome TaxID=652676 RepID=A0A1W1BFZ0_9ZZZZ